LNGIAYDSLTDTFWITGKRWPIMHQVTWEPVLIESEVDSDSNDVESHDSKGSVDDNEMMDSAMVVLISFLFSLVTIKLWGNGFSSLTRSREIDNPQPLQNGERD